MISFSQDSCLASNGCPPPLGIPNRDSTCYAAVALHVLASVHDTSVTGVVLPNISLPSGTVQKIVATISAGGSVGQHNMGRLLSLVEGADYETGKQHPLSRAPLSRALTMRQANSKLDLVVVVGWWLQQYLRWALYQRSHFLCRGKELDVVLKQRRAKKQW